MDEKDKDGLQILLAIFAELNTEIRSRRIAEYTYTASSIAAFGALGWGVTAIAASASKMSLQLLLATVLAILSISVSVILKILDENRKHFLLQKDVVGVADRLKKYSSDESLMPPRFLEKSQPGTGHFYSGFVLSLSASGTILFCVSLPLDKISSVEHTVIILLFFMVLAVSNVWFLGFLKRRNLKISDDAK